jgi:hypothetical protein
MGKWTDETLLKRRNTNGHQIHFKNSAFLVIREMQTKIQWKFHFTPVRMAIIKKTKQMLERIWGEKEPMYNVMGM